MGVPFLIWAVRRSVPRAVAVQGWRRAVYYCAAGLPGADVAVAVQLHPICDSPGYARSNLTCRAAVQVSFSFDIYEYLVGLAEQQEADGQEERRCIWANWVTLILTLGFYGFSFASFGMMVWLNDRKDDGHHGCPSAVFAGSANLLCMIIVSMLSVSNHVRDAPNGPGQLNGVFQASMISAYAVRSCASLAICFEPSGPRAARF